ncbi:hypothetical protein G7K_6361-t1 [Saitoella complicata NRRL Y-17804]|uniref:Uncharacterized protein n=1 Tax=Saitoella complicata (strain BCRC 22490 / CBS 7301 / JCM 7358 / NBRC 10748 / NRRL Y-17804) TaxID=698492 RepID=A0A0E9NRG3_SAICN|nr:hypothetical protein G7K_6361-t1 [Saitoella complicata NRRL Y-17804]
MVKGYEGEMAEEGFRGQTQRRREKSDRLQHDNLDTMAKEVKSGLPVGINRGHKVTTRDTRARPSRRKGALAKRTSFVRDLIREVAGYVLYL